MQAFFSKIFPCFFKEELPVDNADIAKIFELEKLAESSATPSPDKIKKIPSGLSLLSKISPGKEDPLDVEEVEISSI